MADIPGVHLELETGIGPQPPGPPATGVPTPPQAVSAQEICRRKFGHEAPSDPRERARRLRFLAGRGFPAEVAWQAVRGETED